MTVSKENEVKVEIEVAAIVQSYVDLLAQSTQNNIMLNLENKALRQQLAKYEVEEPIEETQ